VFEDLAPFGSFDVCVTTTLMPPKLWHQIWQNRLCLWYISAQNIYVCLANYTLWYVIYISKNAWYITCFVRTPFCYQNPEKLVKNCDVSLCSPQFLIYITNVPDIYHECCNTSCCVIFNGSNIKSWRGGDNWMIVYKPACCWRANFT
jgi:hypothetical protein